jgi:hypothetical protein
MHKAHSPSVFFPVSCLLWARDSNCSLKALPRGTVAMTGTQGMSLRGQSALDQWGGGGRGRKEDEEEGEEEWRVMSMRVEKSQEERRGGELFCSAGQRRSFQSKLSTQIEVTSTSQDVAAGGRLVG